MTASFNRYAITIAALLMTVSAALAAYLSDPLILVVLPAMMAGIYLLQHPVYLFYLLLASIPWSAEVQFSQTLATDLPDEPLMLVMSLATVMFILYQRKSISKFIHPLLLLLALQLVWMIITALLSSHFLLSMKYLLAKGWYLIAFVGAPILFIREKKQLKNAAVILAVSMLSVTVVSVVRHSGLNFSFEKVNDALYPFFRNHVNYSALLVCVIPVALACFHLSNSRFARIFWILCLFVLLAALYLSFSRGAWLALIAALFGYFLLKARLLVFGFVFSILFIVAVVFWLRNDERYLRYAHDYQTTIFHKDFSEHLSATYELRDVSTAERFYRWIAGVRMVEDGWMTGFGPATFYNIYKAYTIPLFRTWVSRNEERSTVHNYFLLTLIEQGVIGLLLFVAVLITFFRQAQRLYHQTKDRFWKTAIAVISSVMVMQCILNFLSDLVETDKVGSVFYLCIAVVIIAGKMADVRRETADVRRETGDVRPASF